MRKTAIVLAAAVFTLGVLSIWAAPKAKMQTWTGWISDTNCAAKGAAAAHKECATTCVKKKAAKWVFVNGETKEVFPIHNQDAVKESDLGREVKVTGDVMRHKSIHIESIQPVG